MKHWYLLSVAMFVACSSAPTKPTPAAKAATMEVAVDDELDAEAFEIVTEAIEFESAGATLTGTLVRPVTDGQRPAAVIAHDWGVRGRDGMIGEMFGVRLPTEVPVYRALADALAARGVSVLIYDKRTCTAGTEPWCNYPKEYTTSKPALATTLVEDVRTAAAWLAARDNVSSVAVIGHGHGAELAAVASLDARIRRVALLQPSPGSLADQATFQVAESIRQIDARITEVGDTPEADLLKTQRAELEAVLNAPNPLGVEAETFADLETVHAQYREVLGTTKTPLFAVLGGVDPGEPPGADAELRSMLGDRLVVIADLCRAMVSVSEDDDPTVLDPEVIARLSAFIGAARTP